MVIKKNSMVKNRTNILDELKQKLTFTLIYILNTINKKTYFFFFDYQKDVFYNNVNI